MKFVKRISLFFIYPLTMFAIGFGSNMAIMEYFYPGQSPTVENTGKQEATLQEKNHIEDIAEQNPADQHEDEQLLPVSVGQNGVITANTLYVVRKHDMITGQVQEEQGSAPDMYIGFSREELAREITLYNATPSLTDQQQGFVYMEIVSFSQDRVVVSKSYEHLKQEKPGEVLGQPVEAAQKPELEMEQEEMGGFFLINEDHYVVVYDHSLENVYMDTDISVDNLPEEMQDEILHMKYIESERELYDFLESYSS